MYVVFSLLAVMTVVMTGIIPHTVPPEWRINDAIFIVPISFLVGGHLLAPLVKITQKFQCHTSRACMCMPLKLSKAIKSCIRSSKCAPPSPL